jgi:hypothetical protein
MVLDRLPLVERSRDPSDDYLFAMAEAGAAEYLVTGDRRDVLALKRHGNTVIITALAQDHSGRHCVGCHAISTIQNLIRAIAVANRIPSVPVQSLASCTTKYALAPARRMTWFLRTTGGQFIGGLWGFS